MTKENDVTQRFLPRIQEELNKLPLTESEKKTAISGIMNNVLFLDTGNNKRPSGNIQPDSSFFNFARKIEEVANCFEKDGLTLPKYLNAALRQPPLFYQSPATVAQNVTSVVEYFADAGLTTTQYLRAAVKQPPLFYQSPETIIRNVEGVVEFFVGNGLTAENYLQAALKQPSLFCQSPTTIAGNIAGLVNRFASEGLTARQYLQAALNHPPLFTQKPATIARHIDIILDFVDRGVFQPPGLRQYNSDSPYNDHAAALDFLLASPKILSLADDNFRLREVHQRMTEGTTSSTLLKKQRSHVERELMRHLGHDDPSLPVPSDGFAAGDASPNEEQTRRFVLRALMHAGYIKGGSLER